MRASLAFAFLATFAAVSLGAACVFDPSVGADARIRCDQNSECPDGLRCAALPRHGDALPPDPSGACVPNVEGADAPVIEGVEVTPLVATEGTEVTIVLRTSPLAFAPGLELFGANGAVRLDEPAVETNTSFTYTLVVSRTDHGEGVLPLRADLVSTEGVFAPAQDAGNIRTDFTPPALVFGSVSVVFGASLFGGGLTPLDDVVRLVEPPPLTALGASSSASLVFLLDEPAAMEPLAGDLDVFVVDEAGDVGPAPPPALQLAGNWHLLAGNATDGVVTVRVRAIDEAGNASDIDIVDVAVARTPPTVPAADLVDSALLVRAPHGSSMTGEVPHATLFVRDDAALNAAMLVVAVNDAMSNLVEIGRYVPESAPPEFPGAPEDFGFDIALTGDPTEVHVALVDAAGNIGQAVRVRDVEIIASLLGKVPGSTFENPHRVIVAAAARDVIVDDVGFAFGSLEASGDQLQNDGAFVEVSAAFHARLVSSAAAPFVVTAIGAQRHDGTMLVDGVTGDIRSQIAFRPRGETLGSSDPDGDGDPERVRSLAFDPLASTFYASEPAVGLNATSKVWIVDEGGFRDVATPHQAFAFDSTSGRLVLFNQVVGQVVGNPQLDVSTYVEGAAALGLGVVTPRNSFAIADAPMLGAVAFVANATDTGVIEVFRVDIPAGDAGDGVDDDGPVTLIDDGATAPVMRVDAAVWDDARGALLVTGTRGDGVAEAWHFDGASWTFALSLPATTTIVSPSNDGPLLAWRRAGALHDEIVELVDGKAHVRVGAPAPLTQRRAALLGDDVITLDATTTWVLHDGAWLDTGASPPDGGNRVHGRVRDAGGAVVAEAITVNDLGETWVFTASFSPTGALTAAAWTLLVNDDPSGLASPGPRFGPALANDAEGRVLLFGGRQNGVDRNDLWRLDGAGDPGGAVWTLLEPNDLDGARPHASRFGELHLDPRTGVVWFTGGFDGISVGDEVWSWDGATWTLIDASAFTSAFTSSAFTSGQAAGVLPGFGLATIGKPLGSNTPFALHVFKPGSGPAGGSFSDEPLVDGSDGVISSALALLARDDHALVVESNELGTNVWRLEIAEPAASVHVDLRALRVPAAAELLAVRAEVTAESACSPNDDFGASLRAWTWTPYGFVERSYDAPFGLGSMRLAVEADDARAMRTNDGVHMRITASCLLDDVALRARTQLSLDAIDVHVRYRLP